MNFSKKFESKLFIQFLILVTIPIMIMGILSYNIYVKGEQLRNELVLKNYSEIIKNDYSSIFSSIRKYYIDFTSNANYKWLEAQESPPYYNYTALSKTISEINGGYALNTYIRGYNYINVEHSWVMSRRGVFEYEDIGNLEQLKKFVEKQKQKDSSVYWINNPELDPDSDKISQKSNIFTSTGGFLVLVKQNSYNQITSILMLELDITALLEVASTYSNLGYETIIMNDKNVLLQTNKTFTEAYRSDRYIKEDKVIDEHGNIYKIVESGAYINGMSYIIGYDINKNNAGANVFIYIAIFVIIGYICIYLILRSLAKYVSKPLAFLQEKAQNNIIHIEKQFLHNLALGVIEEERINRMLSELNLKESSAYKVIVLSLSIVDSDDEPNEYIESIVEEIFKNTNKRCYISPARVKGKAVFLVGSSNYYLLEQKVASVYSEIKIILDEHKNINFRIGISDTLFKLTHINQGYEQCIKAISQENKNDNNEDFSVAVYNEKNIISTENAYDIIIENELIDLIEQCRSSDKIRNILNIIITRIENRCSFDFEKDYCYSKLIITITNIPLKYNISLHYIYNMNQNEIFEKINDIKNIEELVNYFNTEIIEPIISNLKDIREGNKDDIVSNIIQLISESKGNITLNECAENLNYSTTYLSKALVQYKGSSFTDIANGEKLKYAKYLLLTTDYSVNDISDKLGYNNVQNFIRFFKKQTDMTPLSFRKENKNIE